MTALDAATNESAPSNSVNTTPADSEPPTAPAALTVTGTTATSVSLSWTGATDNVGVTGYNVYRSWDPGLPHEQWDLVASDIVDGDGATPNNQWIDQGGATGGPYYYQVAAYNHDCPVDTAEGPW